MPIIITKLYEKQASPFHIHEKQLMKDFGIKCTETVSVQEQLTSALTAIRIGCYKNSAGKSKPTGFVAMDLQDTSLCNDFGAGVNFQVHGRREAFLASRLSTKDINFHVPCYFSFGSKLFLDGELKKQLKLAKSMVQEDSFKDWFNGVSPRVFKENVFPKIHQEHGLEEHELKSLVCQLNLCPSQKTTRQNFAAVVSPPPNKRARIHSPEDISPVQDLSEKEEDDPEDPLSPTSRHVLDAKFKASVLKELELSH